MLRRIVQRYFTAPIFDDPQRAHIANILYLFLLFDIVFILSLMVLNVLSQRPPSRLLLDVVALLISFGALELLRQGYLRLVFWFATVSLGGLVTFIALLSGGNTSPIFYILLLMIVVAGVVYDWRGALLAAAYVSAVSWGLAFLQNSQRLPEVAVNYGVFDTAVLNTFYALGLGFLLTYIFNQQQKMLITLQNELKERQKVEAELRINEQRYRALFERTNDGVFLFDLQGNFIEGNQCGANMLGLEPDELKGKKAGDFIAPRELTSRLENVLTGKTLPTYERTFRRSDGTLFTGEVNVTLVHDRDGKPLHVQSIVRDISLRKQTEAQLRQSEQRYRALFNSNNDGVLIIDLDANILEVSEQAAKMLGYTPEELIGQPSSAIIAADEFNAFQQRYHQVLDNVKLPIYERRLRRKDGSTFITEINVGLVRDEKGNPLYIQSIIRDITERKQEELDRELLLNDLHHRKTQVQTAFEISKSTTTLLDPSLLMEFAVNLIRDRFEFYYVGLFLVDENREYAVLQAGSGEAGKQMRAASHRLSVGGESMVGWCIARRKARIALDVGNEAVRFKNPLLPLTRSEMALPLIVHAEAIGALTVQSDQPGAFSEEDIAVLQVMTDQLAIAISNAQLLEQVRAYAHEMEERVVERTAQLEAANKELEAFSYSVSHDLRAPLRAINGFSRILLEDYGHLLPEDARRYQEMVRLNAIRMGQLIDDLLAFSRMGRKPLSKETTDLNQIVKTVLEELAPEYENRTIEWRTHQMPSCNADPSLLKQVYVNLIGNAVKFTSKIPNAIIEIGSLRTEQGLTYYVKDNGAGFDMRYADKLFGVFQRLHHPDEFQGTGVGLAIVQRIIHKHGGRIWCDAAINMGATFFFTLG